MMLFNLVAKAKAFCQRCLRAVSEFVFGVSPAPVVPKAVTPPCVAPTYVVPTIAGTNALLQEARVVAGALPKAKRAKRKPAQPNDQPAAKIASKAPKRK